MKKEALDQFEASLEKKDNETNYSLYSSQILKNLIENAKITIEGLELVFVYQVTQIIFIYFFLKNLKVKMLFLHVNLDKRI